MKSKFLKKTLALAVSAACMTSGMVIVNSASAAPQKYEFEDGTMNTAGRVFSGDKDNKSVKGMSGKLVFLQDGGVRRLQLWRLYGS